MAGTCSVVNAYLHIESSFRYGYRMDRITKNYMLRWRCLLNAIRLYSDKGVHTWQSNYFFIGVNWCRCWKFDSNFIFEIYIDSVAYTTKNTLCERWIPKKNLYTISNVLDFFVIFLHRLNVRRAEKSRRNYKHWLVRKEVFYSEKLQQDETK